MTETRQRIPVISVGQTFRSLRDAGYSLSDALGEVIDNSIEANANNIALHLEENQKPGGKKHIHRIIITDDGDGMNADTLHYYLQLGFSTRYMQTDTIGKYGVGAKLAALNYAQRIDVWSRISAEEPWLHVYFDLKLAEQQSQQGEAHRLALSNSCAPHRFIRL
jgi:phosphomannomutase